MATYVIGYDLRAPGRNYENLYSAIKQLGAWWHCLDSTWLVSTSQTAVQVRDALLPHIDKNDKLLVSHVSAPGAWYGFDQTCSDWLLKNL